MKLFIVACLKELQPAAFDIFKKAEINVFSSTDVVGFKDSSSSNLMENWFASGDETFDSIFLFSFTTSDNADRALEMIKLHNQTNTAAFPLRAFVVPVEKSSY